MVLTKICKIIACIAVSTSALQSFKKSQQQSQVLQSAGDGEGDGEVESNPPVPVYRYFYSSFGKSNHYLSLSPNTPSGYGYEGIEFYAYAEQAPNTVPIYEIYNHGVVDHSYSTVAETFGGYTQPSIVWYAYETEINNAKPIYHYLRGGHDNFFTRDSTCPAGYEDKGIAFYAYVPYTCDCPEEPAGLCSAWGDPHYTASFYAGNAHMDHYGLGVYQLAASTDGSFEVQVFQCPWMDGAIGTSVISGYAIKAGSTIVNIVKDKVYVNDVEVDMDAVKFPRLTGPMTGSPAEDGFCINSAVGCAKMHYMPQPVNPGFETSFSIQIAENMTAKTGVCAVEACKDKPWGNCKIECGASLFTSAAITMQTQMCGMPEDCSTPADWDPPDGPDDACERGGSVSTVPCDKSVAESFCNDVPEDKKIGCMIDFCSGGCNPDIVIPSSPTPPAPITIVSTPMPPTPTPPTPTPPTPMPPTSVSTPTPPASTPMPPTPTPPTPMPPTSVSTPTPPASQCDNSTGTCTVSEDPHIDVFDGAFVSLIAHAESARSLTVEDAGDKWLVKSKLVSIQARYMPDDALPDRNLFMRAIAVGGEFLRGNKMIITSLEDDCTWNTEAILTKEDSTFSFQEQDLVVNAVRGENSSLVEDLSQKNRGVNIRLPLGISLVVNRLRKHVNVAIKMAAQEGGQEGLCGNFNGVASDDSLEMTAHRFDPNVSPADSLFAELK